MDLTNYGRLATKQIETCEVLAGVNGGCSYIG